jgi:hypothetical protein
LPGGVQRFPLFFGPGRKKLERYKVVLLPSAIAP